MKQRLGLLAALLLVWIPVLVLRAGPSGERLRESSELQLAEGSDDEILVAGREANYRMQANLSRIGHPVVTEQVAPDVQRNPNRVRVLVMGDSFTFGQGAYDMDMRWWKRLEEELATRVGDGVFEIVTIAQNGSSVVTQAGWVKGLAAGDRNAFEGPWSKQRGAIDARKEQLDAALGRLAGPFDALLLGFVDNDVIITSGGFFVPDAEVASYDGLDVADVTFGRAPNPNAALVEKAIAYLSEQFRGVPRLLLPLDTATTADEYAAFPPYQQHGFTVLPNPETRRALREIPFRERMINPVDEHPGPVMTRAFAVDAADALVVRLAARIAQARQSAAPPVRSLVSNFLPEEITVEATQSSSTLRFTGIKPAACNDMMESGMNVIRSIECLDDGQRIVSRVGKEELTAQHLPCIVADRPHAVAWLDRMLPADTRVVVRLLDGPESGLTIQTIGYSPIERLVLGDSTSLRPGDSFTYRSGKARTGIVLTHQELQGCAADSALDSFPPFTVEVQVSP